MAQNRGIFVRTQGKDIELVIKGCMEMLKSFGDNSITIDGLKYDENYGGFKVFFSDAFVVTSILKQDYLPFSKISASIHPITTKLAVHNVFPDSEERFKESIKAQLENLNLKPILNICFIPVSPSYPHMKTGDWIVELDMPEIETADIFRNIGLPDSMRLLLRLRSNEPLEEVRVSHLCSICNSIHHSRRNCSSFLNFIDISNDNAEYDISSKQPPSEIKDRITTDIYDDDSDSTIPSKSTFEIRDRTSSNSSKCAKQHRIEAIASDLERKVSNQTFQFDHSVIKREKPCSAIKSEKSLKRSLRESDSKNGMKKVRFSANTAEHSEFDDTSEPVSDISTTNNAFNNAYEAVNATILRNLKLERMAYNLENENGSPNDSSIPSSSSQPETSFERDPLANTSDHSDSNESFRQPSRATRKRPTYVQVVLPERIRQIVRSRELKEGELDIERLEAFFNHVKKKMSPAKIARQFTTDVRCLQEQLLWVKQQYYLTPKAGSGEDSRFMKWLEGMLDRFDSTPSKRKK